LCCGGRRDLKEALEVGLEERPGRGYRRTDYKKPLLDFTPDKERADVIYEDRD